METAVPNNRAAQAANNRAAAPAYEAEVASSWPVATDVTNDEAAEILRHSNSGVRPMLTRYGYRTAKRVFDIAASGLAITVLFIPGVILSAVICTKSPGEGPLYSQWRVGRVRKDGSYKLFRMLKFRSMVPHAEDMLKDLQDKNEADGPLFKIKEDPRVIPGVGKWIRKHSVDELPQLFNVFIGDMSLIGPRPALPCEVLKYDKQAMRRLTVKAGCGGAWQARGRSDVTFDEMILLDNTYVDNCSPAYDLQLIWATLKAMIVGGGAY